MHYVIYPDTLFLENFICNLLFMAFLKFLFFQSARGKKILLGAFFTAICNTLASILFFHCTVIIQVGVLFPVSGLAVCYAMGIREGRKTLYALYQMTLWILVLGGMIQMLWQWNHFIHKQLIFWIGSFLFGFGMLEKLFQRYRKYGDCMREVVLYRNDKSLRIQGFLDTGNHLIDPVSRQPVSIITEECWNLFMKEQEPPNYCLIPCKTVGDLGSLLFGTRIDYMVIMDKKESRVIERPMIAVTKQSFTGIYHYSILLHSDYC